ATHKALHKLAVLGKGNGPAGEDGGSDPWPSYRYSGPIRPHYPLSPVRAIPEHIARPDYAETGIPYSEMSIRGSAIEVVAPKDIETMRKVCQIAREVLDIGLAAAQVGVTSDEIDRIVHEATIERGGYPSTMNYSGYTKSCCTSVNEVICHGIPDQRKLKDGDIFNLDVSVYKDGFHSDLNETITIGAVDETGVRLVKTARECLEKAMAMVKPGALYRDLGNVIEKHANSQGFSVVRAFVGHGVHRHFHCTPNIPHYARNKAIGVMKEGHVFTIEPMINEGSWKEQMWPDDWTCTTLDGKRSAQFEETMVVTRTGVEILTARQAKHLSEGTSDSAASEDLSHVLKPLSTNAKDKKRAAIHEDPTSKKDEGQEFVVEMTGNLRKKRMVASSRRSQTVGPSSEADGAEDTNNSDYDNNNNTTGNTHSVVDGEPESNARGPRAQLKQSDPKKRRKASGATAAVTDADAHSLDTKATQATKATKAGKDVKDTKDVKDVKDASSSDIAASSKTQRRSHATHASSATNPVDVAASDLSKTVKNTRASEADDIPAAASPAPSAEPSSQKRVLPSRGGMLRDKNAIPMEAALLEPVVPAGEYILYIGSEQALRKASLDKKRVPPAIYGGGEDIDENPSPSGLSSATATATAAASSSSSATSVPGSYSEPPPSAVTHIEVPIFKLCSIGQFLQEEKKRKMQLLSKALAKAEAEAAAEALANAKTNATASPPSSTSRTVSTRQKHKEIVQNQHVSVQTVVPSSSAVSAHHHHPHGKRAMTTSTTLGKIEGISGSAAQEEILSDEVYEKRHRKQEMAEKKVKNREKEKLRHAMYQQQLVVEKLRHMEINRLMPISAFRSLQKKEASGGTDDTASPPQHLQQQPQQQQQQQQSLISLAAARVMQDQYHRRLLREAEENLRRYEQLGLGDNSQATVAPVYSPFSRTRNRLVHLDSLLSQSQEHALASTREKSAHQRSDSTGNARSRKKVKASVQSSDATATTTATTTSARPRAKTVSSSSSPFSPGPLSLTTTATAGSSQQKAKAAAAAATARPQEPPRPPKPITTFIKPGSALASGARKSSRVALAFGEKVPMLNRIDFDLPLDSFVDLIQARFGEEEPVVVAYRKKKEKEKAREREREEEEKEKEKRDRAERDQQVLASASATASASASGEMKSSHDRSNSKTAQVATTPLLSGSASASSASSTLSLSSVATTASSASTTIL
ncbi:Methionine aminopeptidase 1, partial [Mortierella alpina]